MRLIIILSIFFLSALCSCRSSRQSVTEYADSTSVVVDEVKDSVAMNDILSLISASRELDLSGIKVEFYPPDSVHPDSRAAPKTLTIENAKAKESSEQATHETAAVSEQKTVNLSAHTSSALQQDSRRDNDLLRPADWVIFFSILGVILLLTIFLIISIKRKST